MGRSWPRFRGEGAAPWPIWWRRMMRSIGRSWTSRQWLPGSSRCCLRCSAQGDSPGAPSIGNGYRSLGLPLTRVPRYSKAEGSSGMIVNSSRITPEGPIRMLLFPRAGRSCPSIACASSLQLTLAVTWSGPFST